MEQIIDKWKTETETFQQFQEARNCLEQIHKIVKNIYYNIYILLN